MKRIKNLLVLKNLLFLVALLWAGIVTFFCLVDSGEIPTVNIPNADKYIHIFFHFVFTFLWFLFFSKQLVFNTILKPLLYSLAFSFVFGIAIEFLQEIITTTRHADIFDVLSNLTGALLAVFIILVYNKFNFLNSDLK